MRQKYCSHSCGSRSLSKESRQRISEKMKGVHAGSKNGMYGKTPKNTKRIKVFSEKHVGPKEFLVKSSFEAKFIEILNEDEYVISFMYEPIQYKVFYEDSENKKRSYQPDFLVNDEKVIEIKNRWSINLSQTKEKEKEFKILFPKVEYKLISLN